MGVLLGLDYGPRRTGIAVSDDTLTIATALTTHDSRSDGSLFDLLQDLIDARGCTGFVIGLPLTADGREAGMAGRVRDFAARLGRRFDLPVHLVDERFSSAEAERLLSLSGRRRRPKGEIDATAAALILQSFLDATR